MVSVAASSSPSTASSPCAACKFLRRKCQPDCVFAPYFPPDQPQKFVQVHRVFGASNVTKLLNEVNPYQREDAVNSLAYEADMRLRDPVYGCAGVISVLQHQLRQLQLDLAFAMSELSKYQSAAAAAVGHRFTDVNLPIGAAGIGFGLEHFLPVTTRDANHHRHTVVRNCDADTSVAKLGASGGYVAGRAAAWTASASSLMPLNGQSTKPSTAGVDERPAIAPLLRFGE
ncbi:protein ASYMMETRIC LEAVES 2-like [Musa acuminata AAA Group]|uniref:protein ASYMMETRIC LEAVES 2-like n=1 Tax=Musa acuminata AAA Group TaxID=214697 RepID=UPI0031CEA4C3